MKKFWLAVASTLLLMFSLTPKDRAQESPQVFRLSINFHSLKTPMLLGPMALLTVLEDLSRSTQLTAQLGQVVPSFKAGTVLSVVGSRWYKQTTVSEIYATFYFIHSHRVSTVSSAGPHRRAEHSIYSGCSWVSTKQRPTYTFSRMVGLCSMARSKLKSTPRFLTATFIS